MLRTVGSQYLTVVRHYGRFPFRVAFAAILLFGPLALAFEVALLLRIETAFVGGPSVPTAAVAVVAAVPLYVFEYALVRRLVERVHG